MYFQKYPCYCLKMQCQSIINNLNINLEDKCGMSEIIRLAITSVLFKYEYTIEVFHQSLFV